VLSIIHECRVAKKLQPTSALILHANMYDVGMIYMYIHGVVTRIYLEG
jgi:hypothetical protein